MYTIGVGLLAWMAAAACDLQTTLVDDADELYRRAQSLLEQLGPRPAPGQPDILVPPEGIDRGMAIVPPNIGARMPVLAPPSSDFNDRLR
jgi:hypothetical protein